MSVLGTLSALGNLATGGIACYTQLDITLNGQNITSLFPPLNLMTFKYEDCLAFQADNLEIVCPDIGDKLINSKLMKKGSELRITIHQFNKGQIGSHVTREIGAFEVDEFEQSGPPTVFRISATSVPISGQLKLTKKSFLWQQTDLKTLAQTIASRNGCTLVWDVKEEKNVKMTRKEQYNEGDLKFLARVCHCNGLSMKMEGDKKIVIFSEQDYEGKDVVANIDFNTPDLLGLINWRISTRSQDVYDSAEASYTNPGTGQTTTGTAKADPNFDAPSGSGNKLMVEDAAQYDGTEGEEEGQL